MYKVFIRPQISLMSLTRDSSHHRLRLVLFDYLSEICDVHPMPLYRRIVVLLPHHKAPVSFVGSGLTRLGCLGRGSGECAAVDWSRMKYQTAAELAEAHKFEKTSYCSKKNRMRKGWHQTSSLQSRPQRARARVPPAIPLICPRIRMDTYAWWFYVTVHQWKRLSDRYPSALEGGTTRQLAS